MLIICNPCPCKFNGIDGIKSFVVKLIATELLWLPQIELFVCVPDVGIVVNWIPPDGWVDNFNDVVSIIVACFDVSDRGIVVLHCGLDECSLGEFVEVRVITGEIVVVVGNDAGIKLPIVVFGDDDVAALDRELDEL